MQLGILETDGLMECEKMFTESGKMCYHKKHGLVTKTVSVPCWAKLYAYSNGQGCFVGMYEAEYNRVTGEENPYN